MGGSGSKSSQTITDNTVNQNYMNTLNETIMNSAVETMINNASSCSSAINVNNSCNVANVKVGGDFNFGGDQTAQAKVNFNCIQANQTSADMSTSMMASLVAEMKALNGTEAAANLNTASQSSNKTGFASMPSNSKSSSKTDVINNVTNQTISNVENIFKTNLKNNFSVNTVNECVGKTNISNEQNIIGVDVEDSANIKCIQTASIEQVQNCKQLSDAISKTTQATFQELGMTVATESNTGITIESTVSSKSENVSTGPIEEIGNAISDILGAFGLAFLGPIAGPICMCCCCLIIIVVLFFIVSQIMGGSGSTPNMDGISDINGMSGIYESPGIDNMNGMMGGMPNIFSSTTI